MRFAGLGPLALFGLALATAAAVVALYLLRRTPRSQTVSNIAFWRRAAERARPRAPFARRVPWIPLLVSLVVALGLVAELGDPRPRGGEGGVTVLVLAADRTMGARGADGRRRLDEALAAARLVVRAEAGAGRVAVLRAGVRADVAVPLTSHVADAERALATMDADDGTADLAAAVAIARGVVRATGAPGRVVLVADRDVELATDDVPVRRVSVGSAAETVAVTNFDARRDPMALGEYDVRCGVRAYAARRSRARLVIRDRGTVLLDEVLTLGPGEAVLRRAHGFSSAQAELTARLEEVQIEGGRDALAADDVAYAAVPPVVATRVLLVTRGNPWLAGVFGANPTVDLTVRDPSVLGTPAVVASFDVLVLDGVGASVRHPAMMVFDPGVGVALTNPRVTAWAADHRVLRGLRFDQVQVARARALVPSADDRVLVRSGRDVLALARERDGGRSVVLGFRAEDTDLVRRVAFPLFAHDALVWLDRREREFHAWQAPGEAVRAAGDGALVLDPAGAPHSVRGALYDAARAGLYHTAQRALAVSAADQSGSLVADAPTSPVPASTRLGGRLSLAQWLAVLLLGIMAAEWVAVQRGRTP